MKSLLKSKLISGTVLALGGQAAFLMSNMILFLVVVREFSQADFGVWGLYLTIIALLDGLRQGLLQNGLTRFLIINPASEKQILGAGLFLHLVYIAFASAVLAVFAGPIAQFWNMPSMEELLKLSFLPLMSIGTIQGLSVLCFAKGKSAAYLLLNLSYLIAFVLGLGLVFWNGELSLTSILWVQGFACLFPLGLARFFALGKIGFPTYQWIKELLSYGKYIAGTNLFSLLFQKADIFMIGYFLNPAAVGLFHLATKIIQYIELPLSALSQTIYPRLAATHRSNDVTQLNTEYGRGILLLFVLLAPAALLVLFFASPIVTLLSSEEYLGTVPLLMILVPATLIKPWGRVFGLALDAVGKPQVNFQMLGFSLTVNIILNFILIQAFGLIGAAAATSISIVATIILGQIRIKKYLEVSSGMALIYFAKQTLTQNFKLKTS
ncbi:oligosaccharide flippase family protein [Algoriphagus marinus]|uniref:oligosaccharide flippase family protein n=1 Tax=Algoriphagus marinus TaxID=1925762 RepID=UPI00094B7FEE|nr:oligosaccharide flippase family protein [Algoriphagus marinus]